MNIDTLIEFIDEIIAHHTQDRPSTLFLDALGYQHNQRTIEQCTRHNITVYKIPPSTTTPWLQPCDVSPFEPAKQKTKSVQKRERQIDIEPTIRHACNIFSEQLHSFNTDMVQRTWSRIRVSTPEQLRCKSASSSLRRTKSSSIYSNSQP